jgi:hypothetical protein
MLIAWAVAGLLLGPWLKPAVALTLVPNPDKYSVIHDRVLVVPPPGVLANDVGLLGKTAVLVSGPSHGTLSLRSDGGFTYTPTGGYVGTDLFRYRPSGLLQIPTDVTITITNAAPTAANDSYAATTGVTLSVGAAAGVLRNDDDADGDSLTATLVDGGGNGSLSLAANGGFTFKSGGSFTGTRTFTYRATDGIASSAVATVSIVVTAPTPPPTPPPTPAPTPAPTPPPTPAPTPAPTPTPIIPPPSLPLPSLPLPSIPLPSLPLPSLPHPSVSIPPLPIPTPTLRPTLPPVPGTSSSPGASPPPTPTSSSSPAPGATPDPSSSASPSVITAAGGPSAAPGSGRGVTSNRDDGFTVGQGGLGPIDGLIDVDVVGFDALIEWAVPALVLSVPGLLLLLAILAQAAGGLLWLPTRQR